MTEWGKNHLHERLDNGARVIIDKDGHSKLVSIQIWIDVGSAEERDDEHGGAHLLEHMLFESRFGEEHLITKIEQLGADVNAMTGEDLTSVYTTVSAQNYIEALELLLDAVTSPVLDGEKLEREKLIVLEEAAKCAQDVIQGIEVKIRQSFADDSYRRHPIGTIEEIKSLNANAIRRFHQECYVGKNISVIVVGNVESEKVVSLCEKYLMRLPASGRKRSENPCGFRSGIEVDRHEWGFCFAGISFPGAPRSEEQATIALSVIGNLLENELKSKLVNSSNVLNVGVSNLSMRRVGRFSVGISFGVDTLDKSLDLTLDAIADFERFLFREPEFEKEKRSVKRSFVHVEESSETRATVLGAISLSNKNADGIASGRMNRLDQMTLAEVHDLTKRHLQLSHASVYICVPKDEVSEEDAQALKLKIENRLSRGVTKKSQSTKFSPHDVEEVVFDGGLRLYAWKNDRLPIFCGNLEWLGGRVIESDDERGAAEIATGCIGVDGLPVHSLVDEIEKIDAYVSMSGSLSSVGLDFSSWPEHAAWMIQRVLDVSICPTIVESDLKAAKKSIIEGRKLNKSRLDHRVTRRMFKKVFPDLIHGDPDVERFTVDGLFNFWNQNYSIDHAVLGLAGQFDLDQIVDAISRSLERLPRPSLDRPKMRESSAWPKEQVVDRQTDEQATSAHIAIGWPIQVRKERDIKRGLTGLLLKKVLGGSSGYLIDTIRNDHGLIYNISLSSLFTPIYGCAYALTETSSENVDRVCELVYQQVERMRSQPIDKKDFERAVAVQRKRIGSRLESRSCIAHSLSQVVDGWSPTVLFEEDEVLSCIKAEDIQDLANEMFNDRYRVTAIIEPK